MFPRIPYRAGKGPQILAVPVDSPCDPLCTAPEVLKTYLGTYLPDSLLIYTADNNLILSFAGDRNTLAYHIFNLRRESKIQEKHVVFHLSSVTLLR